MDHPSFLRRVVLSGTTASLASVAALAVAARLTGKGALQPVNATSHWWHGRPAANVRRLDLAHTGVGFATHYAACLFWAGLFEGLAGSRPTTGVLVRAAAGTAVIAAAVDYLATPKRFTPGWEFGLSPGAMVSVYAAFAAGLAASAALERIGAPEA